MSDIFRLLMVQANPTAGDIAGNAALARAAWARGRDLGADLVAFGAMFIAGGPVQDLIARPAFHLQAIRAIEALAAGCAEGPALGIGGPALEDGRLFDAWWVLKGGKVLARVFRHQLCAGGLADDGHHFAAAGVTGPVALGTMRLGVAIGADAGGPDVTETLAETGAGILIVPDAAPFQRGKADQVLNRLVARVVETGLPLVHLDRVGGQDELVFDGASSVLNPGGQLALQLPQFDAAEALVTFRRGTVGWRADAGPVAPAVDETEAAYRAAVLALGDYLRKSGFAKVVLGLSGGIDSALVAAMAADAVGAQNLHCLMLPSEFTSTASREDAAALATALGARLDVVPIDGPRAAVAQALAGLGPQPAAGIAGENIQARLRGLLLMAVSNGSGAMLLSTGNKSEVAVGYCTLYGDTNGGFNPLKDMYKTVVFACARWRNANHRPWMKGPAGAIIPERVITRPPSAELRAGQRDEDSLPPYDLLDPIIEALVERDEGVADLVARGFDAATVARVAHLLAISEYKRFQSAPGPRLTPRAFSPDRRYPVALRWRETPAD